MSHSPSRNLAALFLLLLSLITAGGCGRHATGRPLTELSSTESSADKNYRVKAGDTISVQVWGEPKVSGDVFVRDDGKFTLALAGDVLAAGKSVTEVAASVTTALAPFIPSASVTVSVSQSAPIRYFLLGNFVKPGDFRSEGKINLLQAIAGGGGFAPFADESGITLIRKTQQGELRYQFDYNRVVDGKEPNPELKEGDTIAVR